MLKILLILNQRFLIEKRPETTLHRGHICKEPGHNRAYTVPGLDKEQLAVRSSPMRLHNLAKRSSNSPIETAPLLTFNRRYNLKFYYFLVFSLT